MIGQYDVNKALDKRKCQRDRESVVRKETQPHMQVSWVQQVHSGLTSGYTGVTVLLVMRHPTNSPTSDGGVIVSVKKH